MTATLSDIRSALMTREDVIDTGMPWRDIGRAVAQGHLVRIRRGWYVAAEVWSAWWPEDRHRALIHATCREMVGGTGIVAGVSAAAMWRLPFYRFSPTSVHMCHSRGIRASSTRVVTRHDWQVADDDIVSIDGVLCTSLEKTVADTIGAVSPEAGVSIADAALRSVSVRRNIVDEEAKAGWRDTVLDRLRRIPGTPGIEQARRLVRFADGLAQLPGESVSRLQLRRLGFAPPRLQVPVTGPNGEQWSIDFGLDDADALGETDGEMKYTDPALRSGRSIEQVVLDEKYREDWIRGTTQRRFARWGDEHSRTPALLGRRLAAFGIYPA